MTGMFFVVSQRRSAQTSTTSNAIQTIVPSKGINAQKKSGPYPNLNIKDSLSWYSASYLPIVQFYCNAILSSSKRIHSTAQWSGGTVAHVTIAPLLVRACIDCNLHLSKNLHKSVKSLYDPRGYRFVQWHPALLRIVRYVFN